MKKFMLAIALLAFAGTLSAFAGDRFFGSLTIAAGATATSVTQELYRADGPPCAEIDTVFATVASGTGTGVVSFATYEYGETDAVVTSGSLTVGDDYWGRPVTSTSVLYTYPVVQNVVTGNVVLARQNLQTNYMVQVKGFIGRAVVVSIAQDAVAADTVYKWAILTKADPPPKK